MYGNEKWPFGQQPLHESASQLDKCLTSQRYRAKHRGSDLWHSFYGPPHQTAFEPTLTGVWDRIKHDPGGWTLQSFCNPHSQSKPCLFIRGVWFWSQFECIWNHPVVCEWRSVNKLGTCGARMGGLVCPSHCLGLSFFSFSQLAPGAPWFPSGSSLSQCKSELKV